MTYLRPYNHGNKRKRTTIVVLVVVIVFVSALHAIFPHLFPALFNSIATPFWRLEISLGSGSMKNPSELLRENMELKFKLEEYAHRLSSSTVSLLEAQNIELLSMLGRTSTSTPVGTSLAAVLTRPSLLPYDGLVIDLGSRNGVSTTSLVYAPGRVIIGRVVSVEDYTSKVLLYSSPKQNFDISIGASHIPATAMGMGAGQYEAEVPHGAAVMVGDIVTDSTLRNRAFGQVVSIETDPADPFDRILIAPPINIFEVRFVLVETRKPVLPAMK